MIVGHVLPSDLARGAQRYARTLRDALTDDTDTHVIATVFNSDMQVLDADVALGVPDGPLRRAGFDPRAALAISRFVREYSPDVLVAHGGEAFKYSAVIPLRGSLLVYYKIGIAAKRLTDSRLRQWFYRALASRTAMVAGVSQETVDEARRMLFVSEDRTVVIPNGRDPRIFTPIAKEPGRRVVPRLAFVGALVPTKRPGLFMDLVGALRGEGLEVAGVIVGDGPLQREVAARAESHGIEYLGRRSDVATILAGSDVFLFTSVSEGEGMPGVLIEAGLCGLPIVTTDVPGARAVVVDGKTGLVVQPDDFDGMVDAARRLVVDEDLRIKMGRAARERCVVRFSIDASSEQWRDLFGKLVADRDS